MQTRILETAEKELEKISNPLNKQFGKNIEKLASKETNRHLKHELTYYTENITKQARIIYYLLGPNAYPNIRTLPEFSDKTELKFQLTLLFLPAIVHMDKTTILQSGKF